MAAAVVFSIEVLWKRKTVKDKARRKREIEARRAESGDSAGNILPTPGTSVPSHPDPVPRETHHPYTFK